jgi:tetratricopeptide (TPR) repeat protein
MRALIQLCLLVLLILSLCAPAYAQADLYARAQQAFDAHNYTAALELYIEISTAYPSCPLSALRQAQIYAAQEDWDKAVAAYEHLTGLGPLDAETRMAYGDALKGAGRLNDAIEQYKLVAEAGDSSPAAKDAPAKDAPTKPAKQPAAQDKPAQAQDKPAPAKAEPKPTPLAEDKPESKPDPKLELKPAAKPAPAAKPEAKPTPAAEPKQVAPVEAAPEQLAQVPPPTEPAPNQAEAPSATTMLTTTSPKEMLAPSASMREVNRLQPARTIEPAQPGVFMQSRTEDKVDSTPVKDAGAPQTPDQVLVQARRYLELEQYEKALAQYEAYAQLTGGMDHDVRLEYADALREADRTDDAEAEFNRLLHDDADDVDAKVGLAKTIAKRGELEDAMYLLDQIYQSEDALLKAYLARAYAYMVNGYTQEAWTDLGEAMAINPNDPGVLKMEEVLKLKDVPPPGDLPNDPGLRADALFGQGQYEQSKGMYEQMVRKDPGNTKAWLRLATIYRWDGEYADSADAYETYLKDHTDDYESRLRYAQVLYFESQFEAAGDELKPLLADKDAPEEIYEEALVVYGAVLNALGKYKEAAELYREALIYDPHDVSARSQYGGVLASLNRYDEAVAQYEAALREDPGNGEVKLSLARTYSWEGEQRKAQKYYNQIGMTDPYYGASRIGLAYTYLADGDRSQAVAMAAEAEKYDPNNPELAALRAQFTNTGETTVAQDWRKSHDNDDNDSRSLTTRVSVPLDSKGTALVLEYEDLNLDNTRAGLMSKGKYTRAALSVPLADEMMLNLRGGYLDLDNGADPAATEWTHGMTLSLKASDRLTLDAGYSDYTFYDTAELARKNINLTEYTLGWQYKLAANTTLIGSYSWADLSDDNCRKRLDLNLQRGWLRPGQGRLFYGLAYRYLNYSHNLDNGYWDPSNYHYGEVYADWFDMSSHKLRFDGGAGYGIDDASGQAAGGGFRYYAGVRAYPFGERFVLKTGYRSSETAENATSSPGYRSAEWYFTGVASF